MFATHAATGQHVRAGRLRALAVTTATRSPALPELPSVAEAGVPGYDSGVWYGLLAPAGTQTPIVRRLNSGVLGVLAAADVRDRLTIEAIEPAGSTPEAFKTHIGRELAKWAKVVADSGARID
jgi:tripartite-type tricarboxylate transporter receptor subunit TctC